MENSAGMLSVGQIAKMLKTNRQNIYNVLKTEHIKADGYNDKHYSLYSPETIQEIKAALSKKATLRSKKVVAKEQAEEIADLKNQLSEQQRLTTWLQSQLVQLQVEADKLRSQNSQLQLESAKTQLLIGQVDQEKTTLKAENDRLSAENEKLGQLTDKVLKDAQRAEEDAQKAKADLDKARRAGLWSRITRNY